MVLECQAQAPVVGDELLSFIGRRERKRLSLDHRHCKQRGGRLNA
ncbi:hypothetical protein [Pelomicrobium methylotrophicum]|nr:hypothetical protein [Pelomicrobium methylotrophicum]